VTGEDQQSSLLKPGGGFDAASLNAYANALDILFQQNLSAMRDQLLADLDFRGDTTTLKLGLTARQTPEVLRAFERQRARRDQPRGLRAVAARPAARSAKQRYDLELVFDSAGPALPVATNVVVSLVPATTGSARS
jgi:hypothetical protein